MTAPNIRLIATDLDGTFLGEDSRPLPQNAQAFRRAQEMGIHVCIASGRLANVCSRIARKMGLDGCHIIGMNGAQMLLSPFGPPVISRFFPDIRWAAVEGQKEGVPVKPDPSIIFEILGKCPTPKDEVLYVGDSGVDMETARRACVESVGVTWGFRPVKELREYQATHIVTLPAAILPLVTDSLTPSSSQPN